ncbi:hypothetical protein EYF80_011095 [Liparis tanakae]|uniref:Uncharacterized protein n=1 Tax=Liparis tanakae TaxID=230148 RepID=A0A4Z2ILM3_9TELE|nr:hypothetical protein EYF80_011095 [Liparis tanakae]
MKSVAATEENSKGPGPDAQGTCFHHVLYHRKWVMKPLQIFILGGLRSLGPNSTLTAVLFLGTAAPSAAALRPRGHLEKRPNFFFSLNFITGPGRGAEYAHAAKTQGAVGTTRSHVPTQSFLVSVRLNKAGKLRRASGLSGAKQDPPQSKPKAKSVSGLQTCYIQMFPYDYRNDFYSSKCLGGCSPAASAVTMESKPAHYDDHDEDHDEEVVRSWALGQIMWICACSLLAALHHTHQTPPHPITMLLSPQLGDTEVVLGLYRVHSAGSECHREKSCSEVVDSVWMELSESAGELEPSKAYVWKESYGGTDRSASACSTFFRM